MTPTWVLAAILSTGGLLPGPAASRHAPSDPAPPEQESAEPETVEPEASEPALDDAEVAEDEDDSLEGDPAPTSSSTSVGEATAVDRLDEVEAKLGALEQSNERLREHNDELQQRVETLESEQERTRKHVDRLRPLAGRVGGYIDFGFFYVTGDGSGIRTDTGHNVFPEYDGVVPDSWVFMGDPLSTVINSRGDPAETSESRAIVFDPVDSQGKSSFILNSLTLDLNANAGKQLVLEGLVDFIPRNRDVSDPDGTFLSDYINVKLAYVNWIVPTRRVDLDLYAGKIDTVFGYEYRIQEAPDRITVTPSLLCRYTCGRPVGLKGRLRLLPNRALIFGATLANGSSFQESFGFTNEIDTNHFKTAAARLSYLFPVGAGLEIGASGQYGAQDLQPSDSVRQWQYGFDLHLDVRGLDLVGEFIMGKIDGETAPGDVRCGLAPCLAFKAAYGLLGYRALNWLMPYARVDWRDALHESGASFVYVSKLIRFTPGVRFDVGKHVLLKAEYTHIRELGRIPQFNNDIVTTSVVAKL